MIEDTKCGAEAEASEKSSGRCDDKRSDDNGCRTELLASALRNPERSHERDDERNEDVKLPQDERDFREREFRASGPNGPRTHAHGEERRDDRYETRVSERGAARPVLEPRESEEDARKQVDATDSEPRLRTVWQGRGEKGDDGDDTPDSEYDRGQLTVIHT